MNTVGKFVAKVEAAASRNDSAKEVEPIGIPRCRTPVVISDWDPRSRDKASWRASDCCGDKESKLDRWFVTVRIFVF
jgi:hypothetical protein